jgi:hypothetical protein
MKVCYVMLLLTPVFILLSGCNSPESKAKKMFRRQKVLLEMQQEAAQDSVLTQAETEAMIQAYRENLKFNKALIRNHHTDSLYMKTYLQHLNQLSNPYEEEVRASNRKIRASEGYDTFRKRLLELYNTSK